jgi:translation initiation factor 2 beta subunit (eIF-2beta)/eIF-5
MWYIKIKKSISMFHTRNDKYCFKQNMFADTEVQNALNIIYQVYVKMLFCKSSNNCLKKVSIYLQLS